MRQFLSQLSGIIFLVGFIPYILAIFGRQLTIGVSSMLSPPSGWIAWEFKRIKPARPMKVSWVVWLTVDLISLAGMWVKEAVNGQILGAVTGAFLVFALSLKYGKGGWTRVDQWSLVGASAGIGLWLAFDSPVLGILMSQITGLTGAIPTFVNVWHRPQDEPKVGWLIFWLSCLPAVLAIPALGWEHVIQPIGFLIGNSTMMLLLFIRPRFAKAVPVMGSSRLVN